MDGHDHPGPSTKRRTKKSKSIQATLSLGSPSEVLEQNILGAVDMVLPTQGEPGKYSTKFNCVMLPFIYENPLLSGENSSDRA
jgi:hypothetical protein